MHESTRRIVTVVLDKTSAGAAMAFSSGVRRHQQPAAARLRTAAGEPGRGDGHPGGGANVPGMTRGGHDDVGHRRLTRLLAGLGAASGAVLLTRPQRIVDRLCPELPNDRVWLVRLLGARLLVQHGAVLVRPDPALVRAGSALDLLHAASMVPFAGSARYGRAGRISGTLAAAYAGIAMAAAPRSERR